MINATINMKDCEKETLLREICMRASYSLLIFSESVEDGNKPHIVKSIDLEKQTVGFDTENSLIRCYRSIERVKPYLRLLSSMTKDEKIEYNKLLGYCQEQDPVDYNITILDDSQLIFVIDWLNEHRFDYRGLIEKGLALEAPAGMYKID